MKRSRRVASLSFVVLWLWLCATPWGSTALRHHDHDRDRDRDRRMWAAEPPGSPPLSNALHIHAFLLTPLFPLTAATTSVESPALLEELARSSPSGGGESSGGDDDDDDDDDDADPMADLPPPHEKTRRLHFPGTRCHCHIRSSSSSVDGGGSGGGNGRTIVSAWCHASEGFETDRHCNCAGVPIPCASAGPNVLRVTHSAHIPGVCNSVRNGTTMAACEGPPCPLFGVTEKLSTHQQSHRSLTESSEECSISIDRK